jgi:hypothetical protein
MVTAMSRGACMVLLAGSGLLGERKRNQHAKVCMLVPQAFFFFPFEKEKLKKRQLKGELVAS